MTQMFESLKGKKVLVTGSSRGIGKAIALGFAECGADVTLHGIKEGKAMEQTILEAKAFGTNINVVYGDLADPAETENVIKETLEKQGGIDILICNASVQIRNEWDSITDEEMQTQMQVNFFSTLKLIQGAVPSMKKNGWGRVITIGSVQQAKPHPHMVVYAASKAAMVNMVQNLALQLAKDRITVNNVAPGTIYTDRNTEVLKDEAYKKIVVDSTPVGFIGEPYDCVGATLMLASDCGRYITGENLFIDGGKFI